MPINTSKGLIKPLGTESQSVTVINDNMDRVNDYGMGAYSCTSTTRPTGSNLWSGLTIHETDTGKLYVYSGTAWAEFITETVTDALDTRLDALEALNYQVSAERTTNSSTFSTTLTSLLTVTASIVEV